jgi:hypothetical protein
MKRTFCIVLALTVFAFAGWGQSQASLDALLQPLGDDIQTLMTGLGKDIAPQLLQGALAQDIVGEAAFKGGFPHGTVVVPALGAGFGNGIATVLNGDSGATWKFTLPMPSLLDQAMGGTDTWTASRKIFPYPAMAVGLGFGIAKGYDVIVSGIVLPQSLTSKIVSLAPSSVGDLSPEFSVASVVVKLRKTLTRDGPGLPAMSIGLGGAYGKIHVGAQIDLDKLNGQVDLGTNVGKLNMVGPLSFDTNLFALGLEFAISKRFLIFTPFASVGVWYRHAVVNSVIDLTATITPPSASGLLPSSVTIDSSPTATSDGFDGRLAAGLELNLFVAILHFGASLDLIDPLVNIQKFSLTGMAANGLSVNCGLRFQF